MQRILRQRCLSLDEVVSSLARQSPARSRLDRYQGGISSSREFCSMADYRHIEVSKNGVVYVARFLETKILNDMVIEGIARELFDLAAQEDCTNLLLNFTGVGFLSSSVLGKLITLNKRMKAKGGQLKLCEMKPEILELFTLTNLTKIFDIRDDETAGMMAFY